MSQPRVNPTMVLVGVGLMGQDCAQAALEHLGVKRLILIDHAEKIRAGTNQITLSEFARTLRNPSSAEIVSIVADISNTAATDSIFSEIKGVHYLLITSGISPRPLTPPEKLSEEDYLNAFRVNTLGPINVVNSAVRAGSFSKDITARAVVLLSTASKQGAEGRASNAYEVSKWGLRGWLECQAWYYLTQHGVVLNGISPNPLEGPMASGNPVSAGRVKAVIDDSPLGLTRPANVTALAMYYLSDDCNAVGQVMTLCGGYHLPHAVYGPLGNS